MTRTHHLTILLTITLIFSAVAAADTEQTIQKQIEIQNAISITDVNKVDVLNWRPS